MAAFYPTLCDLCMENYRKVDRKSMTLCCGHNFCLTCLARLKKSSSRQCPICGGNWAELEGEALALEHFKQRPMSRREKEKYPYCKKSDRNYLCNWHALPYQFWCNEDEDFYCIECAVDSDSKKLLFIEDAIPRIKSELHLKVVKKAQQIKSDIAELEKIEEDFKSQLNTIERYEEAILKHKLDIKRNISNIESLKTDRSNDYLLVDKMEEKIEKIDSDLIVSLAVESKKTLEDRVQPLGAPVMTDSEVLLCNIASVFMERANLERSPSKAAFINELLKTPGNNVGLLTELFRAVAKLKKGEEWTLDTGNCLVAILALHHMQPSVITLLASPGECGAFPTEVVAALAKAAGKCAVHARFLDSFQKSEDATRDLGRLEALTKHSSLLLTVFYGHLEAAGIAKLPHTITRLGLAIGSAADAAAVSGLRPWEKLWDLHVAVNSSVAAKELRPLPSDLFISLHFPDLTDARVDCVRPAIEALVPGKKLWYLCLPASQLTTKGASRLVRLLRGVVIDRACFEGSGFRGPGKNEMGSVEGALRRAVVFGVDRNLH